MRLCLVTREYASVTPYTGGIGASLAALAPELARSGHETVVLTFGRGEAGGFERDGVQFHLLELPIPQKLWFLEDVAWTFTVDRALRRLGRFDVVYASEWGGDAWRYARHKRAGPLMTKLATSLAQALQISPGWRRSLRMRFRHLIQNPMERGQAERSDLLVAPSRAILDWARELWSIDAIPSFVIPNPVDVGRVLALAKEELPHGFPRRGPVVFFSGRLEIRKGAQVLVQAMDRVWDEYPDAQLVMVGRDGYWENGLMSEHLREVAAGRTDRLHLLGAQPHERLFPALAAADVVAVPSLWEAFGNVVLEAMALGRPIVATGTGGFLDLVREGRDGLLVPPNDSPALADGLLRLLGDRALRERLGASAATRAEQFAPPSIAARFTDCIREVSGARA
jgi:glycogen synthase